MRRHPFPRTPHHGHHDACCVTHKPCCWLKIHKIDSRSTVGLLGAVFALENPDGVVLLRESNEQGRALFPVIPCVPYLLTEITPPVGYLPSPVPFVIMMDHAGRLFVNGECVERFVLPNDRVFIGGAFTAFKIDRLTHQPIADAGFTLWSGNEIVATAVSGPTGELSFGGLLPGTYLLQETGVPDGYQPAQPVAVVVDECGETTINGRCADGYILENIPVFDVSFFKVISGTMDGLPGATFVLSTGGSLIATAVSGADGLVDLGAVAPGTYQLTETQAPDGYQPNPSVYTVVITPDGMITIDGAALGLFTVANEPAQVMYTVYYYADSIAPANLLGTVNGLGNLGEFINADLTLYAPAGYQVPGTRSGATFITSDPASNVVYVVYARAVTTLLNWTVTYYADSLSPQDVIASLAMDPVEAGTVVTLTEAQLNAFRPAGYDDGVQIGGPVAIIVEGQVIQVLYQA